MPETARPYRFLAALGTGVPFISYPPIAPGETFTYRFPIRQAGTYWYHSHTGLQELLGVYGSIVILPNKGGKEADHDHVVLLSDWTNEKPMSVLRTLRRGSEYYGIKKKSAQSLIGAIKTGKTGDWLRREAMRMPASDIADGAYDAVLVNGAGSEHFRDGPLGFRLRGGRWLQLPILSSSHGE